MKTTLSADAILATLKTDKILTIRVNGLKVSKTEAKNIIKRNFAPHVKLAVKAHELRVGRLSYLFVDTRGIPVLD